MTQAQSKNQTAETMPVNAASLAEKLSHILGQAFVSQGLPEHLGEVRPSDRPDLAQFQCNGAMAAAKIAKKAPRQVAEQIVESLKGNTVIKDISIAGPGFINIHVADAFLTENLETLHADKRIGVPDTGHGQTVIFDYGGMNIAKAMHVGHMRPTLIGDCLKYIYRFAGYNALGDIHLGDWGLPIGQIISEFQIRHPEWVYFDEDFDGEYPEEPPFSYDDLEKIYPEASNACKEDEERLGIARQATAELQEGRSGYRALLDQFLRLSIKDIKKNLKPYGVEFEIWKGESDVNDLIPEITEDLKERNIGEESHGAFIIPVVREDDNQEIPPLMYFKSDGAVTYGTTDIATIYDRVKLYSDLKKIIYVVDKRQSLHFEQVFRATNKAGYTENIDLVHIGNGTVNGNDGRPYKTRQGGVMRFADMTQTAIDKALERLDEADLAKDMSDEERTEVARIVAVAALKFNELSNQPYMDYIFDLERMIKFEGKTGPYILYQVVRIQSLLSKAGFDPRKEIEPPKTVISFHEEERSLALLLTEFPDHFSQTLKDNSPHVLCEYVFRLAQEFSRFYSACHILSEENEDIRTARLWLTSLTLKQFRLILKLLGIEIPERM